eukprot:m.9645 g.9645  ORF g.9645 m.9645 type:complete len:262 (+) comp2661_c0_seq1:83-868(+)
MSYFFAFDFDGVLCDSARETGTAGLTALMALTGVTQDNQDTLVNNFTKVRPVLETGWESVLLVHLLSTGRTPEDIVGRFGSELKSVALNELSHDEAAIKAAFRAARDTMIAASVESWMALHDFYPHAVDTVVGLLASEVPVYVITTKAKDFAERLLAQCGILMPSDRVFGLGSGPKPQVLKQLLDSHGQGARCLFLEDRVQTLLDVQETAELQGRVDVVLADWGYNMKVDRDAASLRGVTVVAQKDLTACCDRFKGASLGV